MLPWQPQTGCLPSRPFQPLVLSQSTSRFVYNCRSGRSLYDKCIIINATMTLDLSESRLGGAKLRVPNNCGSSPIQPSAQLSFKLEGLKGGWNAACRSVGNRKSSSQCNLLFCPNVTLTNVPEARKTVELAQVGGNKGEMYGERMWRSASGATLLA